MALIRIKINLPVPFFKLNAREFFKSTSINKRKQQKRGITAPPPAPVPACLQFTPLPLPQFCSLRRPLQFPSTPNGGKKETGADRKRPNSGVDLTILIRKEMTSVWWFLFSK